MENCNVNNTGIEKYYQENEQLAEFFIEKYFYSDFSVNTPREEKQHRIEFIISPRCNLGCKYCYVHRFRDQIFNESCFDAEKTITNLKLILKWLEKKRFNPNLEIFSGELFAQEVGYQVLLTIYEHFRDISDINLRPESIVIPTNYTFICDADATARVEDIREKLGSVGIKLCLSASFDGKYMEQNRPYIQDLDIELGGIRDDDYYDRVFEYNSKTYGGFHPMVYSKNIKNWKKNFDWFQEMFEKHGIPWWAIYLLQVRNEEWTKEDIKDFGDFIDYLYEFLSKKLNREDMADFILKDGFNLLTQPYVSCGRGLTCAIQNQFSIRPSDLMMYPCHRTGYEDFYYGQMIEDEEEVLKFKCKNVEQLVSTYSIHKEALPMCSQCPIAVLCAGPCLGAQYESNKNLYAPIPSVCLLTYELAIRSIKNMKKYNIYGLIINRMDPEKMKAFTYLEEKIKC